MCKNEHEHEGSRLERFPFSSNKTCGILYSLYCIIVGSIFLYFDVMSFRIRFDQISGDLFILAVSVLYVIAGFFLLFGILVSCCHLNILP